MKLKKKLCELAMCLLKQLYQASFYSTIITFYHLYLNTLTMLNLNQLKLIIAAYFLLVLPLSAQSSLDYRDGDGLIDITTLAQLNAIRYDLDGNGAVADTDETAYGEAFPTVTGGSTYGAISCGNGGTITSCNGYELMNNLDFDDLGSGTPSNGQRTVLRVA